TMVFPVDMSAMAGTVYIRPVCSHPCMLRDSGRGSGYHSSMAPRHLALAALLLAFAANARCEPPSARSPSDSQLLTHRSRHWILQLPADLAARRPAESWGAAADRRLEEIAGRLGVKLPDEPLHLYVDDSTRRLEERAGSEAPFTLLPDRREVAHLIAPEGTITDASGDALLLLHLAWGPPASEA